MQTLTIGRTKYKLSPSRNVGELQAKVSKITGKTKKTAIAKCRRSYPVFFAGQSTDEYVKSFYMLNFRDSIGGFFEPLNSEPCTLYSGEDVHETLTDDGCAQECAAIAQEAAPVDPAPVVDVPAPVEAATPVAADPDLIAPDTLREMNRAHGIASEQISAIRSYCLNHPGSHVADMLRSEAARYGRRSDKHETNDAWARIYRQVSDEFRAAAELEIIYAVVPAPRPRVIYSEFIRSAGKREAPMTA